MAEYLLRNSLNPSKVVVCNITFRQLIDKSDEGDPIWVVEIRTIEPHKDGGPIPPVYINYTSKINLDNEIKAATEYLSKQINWEPLIADLRPPFVSFCNTSENEAVSIYSDIVIDIADIVPAAGINVNSIKMSLNDIDVTDELQIEGDPYKYRIIWQPYLRVID